MDICITDDCQRVTRTRGLCNYHYEQWKRSRPNQESCAVEGCPKLLYVRGWCLRHYKQWRYWGTPFGDRLVKSTGYKYKDSLGYIRIKQNDGSYEAEHRLVLGQILGRPLESYESAHHLNGIRDDNRAENLELWISPQPSGIRASQQLPHCKTCKCIII